MSGRWQELGLAWHETNTVHCSVCGKLIPRRAWIFADAAGEIATCGPECEQLYETYWRPTYGIMKPASGAGQPRPARNSAILSRTAAAASTSSCVADCLAFPVTSMSILNQA